MLQATVKRVEGYSLLGKSNSNHWIPMYGPKKIGAEDAAARPKELLLLALGGCTAFDVEMILRKRRVQLDRFDVELEADEAGDHPMVFTEVRMTYRFEGEQVPAADVERAIRLSEEKYCSVSAMLRKAFPIRWKATINGDEVLTGPAPPEPDMMRLAGPAA
jgi:putative redox protein